MSPLRRAMVKSWTIRAERARRDDLAVQHNLGDVALEHLGRDVVFEHELAAQDQAHARLLEQLEERAQNESSLVKQTRTVGGEDHLAPDRGEPPGAKQRLGLLDRVTQPKRCV